ncbi:aldo/keto reductase [Schaalia naturae]|uniref:Aldo/keto reductase n=1 Tax=Schaalia naturae TaxID=635203 RepID=A0ABW2SHW5_9ACTO
MAPASTPHPAPDIPTLTLATGAAIPQLGFGTYKVTEKVVEVVSSALALGYRHIDTAQMYHNEAEVGQAWAGSGIAREDLFLTSKLDNPNHEPSAARRSFAQTLLDLRTDYVDLFLIHWPLPMHYGGDFVTTWKVLEEFLADGRARAIGVSNFEPHHLRRVLDHADITPMVNQVEAHPYLPNRAVHDFDAEHGILTEAWSPLARGRAASDPVLAEIGEAHGATASQVALRWALQRGDIVFPKSVTPARQAENLQVFSFELSADEVQRIDALNEGEKGRTGTHPDLMDRL